MPTESIAKVVRHWLRDHVAEMRISAMQFPQCDRRTVSSTERCPPPRAMHCANMRFLSAPGVSAGIRDTGKKVDAKYSRNRADSIEKNVTERRENFFVRRGISPRYPGHARGQLNEIHALANIQSIDGRRGHRRCFARLDLFYSCAAVEGRYGHGL